MSINMITSQETREAFKKDFKDLLAKYNAEISKEMIINKSFSSKALNEIFFLFFVWIDTKFI